MGGLVQGIMIYILVERGGWLVHIKYISHLISAYLYVIVPVVVQIENAVDFAVGAHVQIVGAFHTLADRLAGVFLHLNVVELAAKTKQTRYGTVFG